MTNILEAICHIISRQNWDIEISSAGKNRVNAAGYGLEDFIKNAFAGTFSVRDEQEKLKIFAETFSWLGSQNNPPDLMIRGGDAIEVKKIQSANGNLAFNSSYPKNELTVDHPMITHACQQCEYWQKKDLIYCVGQTSEKSLQSLWLVYGQLYAAEESIYQRIKETIAAGIDDIPNVIFSPTKELGRVNQVDPLGITNLRIRGMWEIANPKKVFSYLYQSSGAEFELIALIPIEKWNGFPKESREKIEQLTQKVAGLTIESGAVKNPNNPANLIPCKWIKFVSNNHLKQGYLC